MSNPEKPTDTAWVSTRHLQHMMRQAEAAGVPAATLLAATGLSRISLADVDGTIPMSAIEAVISTLDQYPASVMAGLQLAREIQPATFGALGLLLQS
nr:AraC family transcriptional regulator ligand-binding domain-containing protein [Moraxellaceae bacterium]